MRKSFASQRGDVLDALKVISGVKTKEDKTSINYIIGKKYVSVIIDDGVMQLKEKNYKLFEIYFRRRYTLSIEDNCDPS
ncbi:MAG: hypothetical protein FDW93_06080 [Bergeyella sp.]|nr:hypothetical protein [Bergeyella sp.]